jgi:hypothetical protein
MKKKPSLVVDFDGVICEHRFPDVGEPTEGVQEALDTLGKAGLPYCYPFMQNII